MEIFTRAGRCQCYIEMKRRSRCVRERKNRSWSKISKLQIEIGLRAGSIRLENPRGFSAFYRNCFDIFIRQNRQIFVKMCRVKFVKIFPLPRILETRVGILENRFVPWTRLLNCSGSFEEIFRFKLNGEFRKILRSIENYENQPAND